MQGSQRKSGQNDLPSARQLQRRYTCREIVLPAAIAVTLLIVGLVFVFVRLSTDQVGLVADWMLIWTVLCPSVLCLFAVYVLLVATIWGSSRARQGSGSLLSRLETQLANANTRIRTTMDDVVNRIERWTQRLETLEQGWETEEVTDGSDTEV